LPGGGVPRGRRSDRASVNLVPLLLTGVRLHPPGRTDKKLCRCFGAPVRRGFPDHPDHLIPPELVRWKCLPHSAARRRPALAPSPFALMPPKGDRPRFPAARIKKMMQADEDVGRIAAGVPPLVCELPPCCTPSNAHPRAEAGCRLRAQRNAWSSSEPR
jgi:hypothetical protein